jgi:hypothetical protein
MDARYEIFCCPADHAQRFVRFVTPQIEESFLLIFADATAS